MNLAITLKMKMALLVCQMKRLFSVSTEFFSSEVRNKTTCYGKTNINSSVSVLRKSKILTFNNDTKLPVFRLLNKNLF